MKAQAARLARRRTRPDGDDPNKSLAKAFRILNWLAQNGPEVGVIGLSAQLGLNKTTVYRLLTAMERFGIIEQNPENEKYRLGLRLFELGNIAVQSRALQGQARPYLMEMSRLSSETVHLAVVHEGEVVYLDKIESPNTMVSIPSGVGRRLPSHCTGVGKAMLAFLPAPELDRVLGMKPLAKFTESTITSIPELRRQLQQIRARGYATDNQETERGLSCVAAPILDHQNRVVASISLSGPTIRFRGKELATKVDLVKKAAAAISRSLGYQH